MREASRVQIDHPAILEELKTATGDLVQALWEKANVAAKAEFDASIVEANASVLYAQRTQAKAEEVRDQLLREQSFLGERLKIKTSVADGFFSRASM